MRVAAVVLAAGASTRLGRPKQLVRLAGKTLVERTIELAGEAGCAPVVVVLGSGGQQIETECNLARALVVTNTAWAEGMGGSIRCGVEAARAYDVDAIVVLACDQLQVTAHHLRELIRLATLHQETVASEYDGRRGVPACFVKPDFSGLLALRGDRGARDLLQTVRIVSLPGGSFDVDTPEDLDGAPSLQANQSL